MDAANNTVTTMTQAPTLAEMRTLAAQIYNDVSHALETENLSSDVFAMYDVDFGEVLDAMDADYDLTMVDAICNYLMARV